MPPPAPRAKQAVRMDRLRPLPIVMAGEGPPSTPVAVTNEQKHIPCPSAAMNENPGRRVAARYVTRARRGLVVAARSLRSRGLLLAARRSASLSL